MGIRFKMVEIQLFREFVDLPAYKLASRNTFIRSSDNADNTVLSLFSAALQRLSTILQMFCINFSLTEVLLMISLRMSMKLL